MKPNQRATLNRLAQINGALPLTEDYNGWKNRETWNVALWIGNDEGLYRYAKEFPGDYEAFAAEMRETGSHETPDGVSWTDSALDIDALDDMMKEL